ncbi:MAG TPA: tyrosine-protein phosphatase [Nocardioidaceae bacterium]|nr:tyrosine-protein phosphatase [Nocardioidaceae bacterium]
MLRHPVNVRDLGGLPLEGGGSTRPGVLLRGDAPYAGDVAPPGVVWPPRVVVDLRDSQERDRSPYAWPEGTVVHSRELHDRANIARISKGAKLLSVYDAMIEVAGPAIASMVELVGHGPAFVHCTAGKDRTGFATIALLLLAGVEESAVIEDYRRTEAAMEGVMARLDLPPEILELFDPEWALAPEEAARLMIDHVTGWAGGVRGWFLDHGATDAGIDRFRAAIRVEVTP